MRSGTSIGANIHEGNYASSRADFINKFQIALKECYETDYWLGIFRETGIISEDDYLKMFEKCSKIRKLLTASIKTAKNKKMNCLLKRQFKSWCKARNHDGKSIYGIAKSFIRYSLL